MPLDPQIAAFLAMANTVSQPSFDALPPDAARQAARQFAQWINADAPAVIGVESRPLSLGEAAIAARLYVPAQAAHVISPALLFFHGGGWAVGDLDTHDRLCRLLARGAGVRVIAVDYRLAPEHPFPAPVEDALSALSAVMNGDIDLVDTTRILVGGDSAGGTLAAVVAQEARGGGWPALRGQLLIYPATDLAGDYPSHRTFAEGYFLTMAETKAFIARYAPDPGDRRNPRVSPLHARDLAGLPPAIIATAGYDPLRDQGVRYAACLADAGTSVIHHDFDGLIHGFALMDPICRAAADAIATMCADLRTLCGGAADD